MNQVDAYKILAEEMASYRTRQYAELAQLVGSGRLRRVAGADSTSYSVEVKVRWRNGDPGDLLVEGWIAEDTCGPLHRLDEAFIVSAS
jgi:hypothetical protein